MAAKNESKGNNLVRIIGILIVVALIAAGGAAAWFFSGGEININVAEAVQGVEDAGSGTRYVIDAEQSEARFLLDEVLNGEDFTVVGTTADVAGEIVVKRVNPAESQVGQILINARSLQTDNNFRDQAMRRFILLSAEDQYELITFQPTALEGLPEERIEAGEEINFQIIGDITVIDTTTSVTFDTTATLNEDGTLNGLATLTIPYADLGVEIPQLPPQVASVDELVTLEIDFVAVEASDEDTTADDA